MPLSHRTGWVWIAATLRWIEFGIILFLVARYLGQKHGGKAMDLFGHWSLPGCSFLDVIDHWMGILFVSLPLIVAYYFAIYPLALAILPANDPEDIDERRKRFLILAAYTWGAQRPMYASTSMPGKKT